MLLDSHSPWVRPVGGVCVCVRCACRHVGGVFEMRVGVPKAHR